MDTLQSRIYYRVLELVPKLIGCLSKWQGLEKVVNFTCVCFPWGVSLWVRLELSSPQIYDYVYYLIHFIFPILYRHFIWIRWLGRLLRFRLDIWSWRSFASGVSNCRGVSLSDWRYHHFHLNVRLIFLMDSRVKFLRTQSICQRPSLLMRKKKYLKPIQFFRSSSNEH